jgi:hypothetical protein
LKRRKQYRTKNKEIFFDVVADDSVSGSRAAAVGGACFRLEGRQLAQYGGDDL